MHEYGVMGDGQGTAYGDDTCTEYILENKCATIKMSRKIKNRTDFAKFIINESL